MPTGRAAPTTGLVIDLALSVFTNARSAAEVGIGVPPAWRPILVAAAQGIRTIHKGVAAATESAAGSPRIAAIAASPASVSSLCDDSIPLDNDTTPSPPSSVILHLQLARLPSTGRIRALAGGESRFLGLPAP